MKRITALFVVCALAVFGFGNTFADMKAGARTAAKPILENVEDNVVRDASIYAPLSERPRANNAMLVPIVPGIYTIGAAGTYTTLSAAVAALMTNGVDSTLVGDFIFEFIDASYTDTSQTLGPIVGQGGAGMIIFRPMAGNVAKINITGGVASLTFCIRLNNVRNMVWDGSNSGGSDRSLTIEPDTITAVTRAGIIVQRGSDNVTLKNLVVFSNRRSTAMNGSSAIAITNTTFGAFGSQDNITVHNCLLRRALNGVSQTGATGAIRDMNLTITNNTIGSGTGASYLDQISQAGIIVAGNENSIISGNDVDGVAAVPAVTTARGINLTNAYVNMTVTRNKVHNIQHFGAAGNFPYGLLVANSLLSAAAVHASALIANNLVYDIHNHSTTPAARLARPLGYNATGAGAVGLGLTLQFYHNSIYQVTLPSEIPNGAGTLLDVGSSFGGGVIGSADTAYIKNNIIASDASGGNGYSTMYLDFAPTNPVNRTLYMDNNLFYEATGAPNCYFQSAYFGFGNLPDWQTAGFDLVSKFGDPKYVSPTNLNITTTLGVVSSADSVGLGGLQASDFASAPRDLVRPDAGAYEFAVSRFVTDLEATSFDYPSPTLILAASAAFSPQATFTNRGSGTLLSAASVTTYIYNSVPSLVYTSSPVSVTVGGYDNTTQVTFSSVLGGLPAGLYTVRSIATIAGDASVANDTVYSTLAVQASMTSSSFPYTEDFEDPSPETAGAGWISAADVGSPNDWVIATPTKTQISGAHSGVKSFVTKADTNYSDGQDSYIFAPILDLSTFTDLLLVEFYSNFQTESTWDGGSLQMSTDGGLNWVRVDSTLGSGGNFNTAVSTAWYNQNVNANHTADDPWWSGGVGGIGSTGYSSADGGGYVRSSTVVAGIAGMPDVRFRWHFSSDSNTNGEGWSIDDVSFSALAADDIGVSAVGIAGYVGGPQPNRPALTGRRGGVLTPNATNRPTAKSLGAVVAGTSIDFQTEVSNFGANGQTSYNVDLTVDGVASDSDVNSDSLDYGDTDSLTLSWSAPTTGIHQAKAWTTLAGDAVAANDTATFDFEVLAPEVVYYEGFNSGTWPSPGWDTLDVDGKGVEPASWQQDVIAIYEGAHSAGGYYGQSNGLYIDDWLISPNTGGLLDVSYTVDSLSFYAVAAGSGFPDSIMILVSTVDTDPANFTTVLDYVEIPSSGWTKYTYALPDAAVRHIAFRYLHYDGGLSGNNSNAFSLDDVRITRYNFANGLTITPGSINYGLVPSGFSSAETLKVNNNGNVALAISSVTSDNADFVVVPGAGVIPPGDSANFVVTFTPSTIGVIAGNIVFTSDADSSPDTATVGGIGGTPLVFLTLSPDSVFNEDPLKPGKSKKPAKHQKHLFPNWSNLIDELNAQGGFGPATSESDSAGGMVIGHSYMYSASPGTPLTPKWKAQKDSAKIYCWVRLAKWDFKKNIGKSFANIQKTLRDKTIGFHTGPASGLDTTTDGKFKKLAKQLTSLSPKKQNNKLFAELVALKVNIAASAMGKTPAGFGDLIFDTDGNFLDEMSVIQIADMADSLMTHYSPALFDTFDSLYSAVYNINRSCIGALDTASFDAVDSVNIKGKLTLYGQVNIATVPYLKLPPMPFVATRISALNGEVESPEDFDDEGDFDVESMPVAAQLMQNYPNPFNPSTTIAFRLKEVSKVTIKIFNLLGQEVATLVNGEELEEGAQSLQFSAEMLSSGVYFYRIEAQGLEDAALKTVETRKMMLLK